MIPNVNEFNYLIIAGVPKAGTTSLFRYLSDHPDICGSNLKETCFFLDPGYPRKIRLRYKDGLENYESYFNHCENQKIRLEATPVYLYSHGTPEKIKRSLPNVKLIFILRDPIDRLVSYYRFERQANVIPSHISFEDFVMTQLENGKPVDSLPIYMRALEEGNYAKYLEPFFDTFDKDEIFIIHYDELKDNPFVLLESISCFVGIESGFYKNYKFDVYHSSMTMRFPIFHGFYLKLRSKMRKSMHERKNIRILLRNFQQWLEPIYFKLNRREREQISIPESLHDHLKTYYSWDQEALANLLNTQGFTWD